MFSLDGDNFVITCSSGNTNSMVVQHNSLLQKIRRVQGDQTFFDVGCPCHLAHLRAKEFSVNVEDFVIEIYHSFCRSEKLKNSKGSS